MSKLSYLKTLLQDFEDAAVTKSWMGNHHPDTHEDTELWYTTSKATLLRYLEKKIDKNNA